MDSYELRVRNIRVRGKNWILNKLAEECAELNLAILQYFNKDSPEDNIVKEAADVEIALEYIRDLYSNYIVDVYRNKKLVRIENKVIELENVKNLS